VCGTVNDLLTTGAKPLYLSAGFILEEGLAIEALRKVCKSMAETAAEAGVRIVTGDTKVIEGSGGMYINTAGVGGLSGPPVRFEDARDGDARLLTGPWGDHHACILGQRMRLDNDITSDAAPLGAIVESLTEAGVPIHGMRDVTRGGLATILSEIVAPTGLSPVVREESIPVADGVRSFARILGLDPLYMGNEGKMLLAIPSACIDTALAAVRQATYGGNATIIGSLERGHRPLLVTRFGGEKLLPPARGEGLPRIC
jgi:hydrogenase expression/formation protein HypE